MAATKLIKNSLEIKNLKNAFILFIFTSCGTKIKIKAY